MSTEVCVRKCKVCTKENPKEHWRKVTEYGLGKMKNSTTYNDCLQLRVNDTLCNSCYCALVMYDTNKKYQGKKRKKNDDTAYHAKTNKKCRQVVLEADEYIQLFDKAKSSEELIARIHELEAELKNTIRLKSNFYFICNIFYNYY
jgi:hypothetical protein